MGKSSTTEKRCSVEDCERKHYGHGFCQVHYARVRRTGVAGGTARLRAAPGEYLVCTIVGCEKAVRNRGLCGMHYQREQKHGDAGPVATLRLASVRPCSVDGCDRIEVTRAGMCKTHYRQSKLTMSRECIEADCGALIRRTNGVLSKRCRPCQNQRTRERTRELERTAAYRRRALAAHYRVTPEYLDGIWDAQDHRCAHCLKLSASLNGWYGGKDWHIDHDHACCPGGRERKCGKCVRGILCKPCNQGSGQYRDDPAILRRAADYHEVWQNR